VFDNILKEVDDFLTKHKVDAVKDIFVPTFGLDKLIALIAIIYAIRSFRTNNKIARVNLLFQLNNSHRDIWSGIVKSNLTRINDPNADSIQITVEEERYIIFLLLHIHTLFEASEKNLYDFNSSSRLDVGTFFNHPLPSSVWNRKKQFYSTPFSNFIDNVKAEAQGSSLPHPKILVKLLFVIKKKGVNSGLFFKRSIVHVLTVIKGYIINSYRKVLEMLNASENID